MAKKAGHLEKAPYAGGITEELMLKVIALKNKLEESSLPGQGKEESHIIPKGTNTISPDVMKQDDNGNALSYEQNCPFDKICDFLQALVTKKYKKALSISTIILSYEPGNEIVNEFRQVLEEMVTVNDDIRNGGGSDTLLGRFDGGEDGGGGDYVEGKNGEDVSTSEEESSDESSSSDDSSSDELSGPGDTSSSSSDTESSDERSSSEEEADNSQDPLEKICNSVNGEEDTSAVEDDDSDEESDSTSSASSLSSHDSTGDSEDDDISAQLDTDISALIEHFQGTLGSLDVQDTFDLISSLDLEDDDEDMNTLSVVNTSSGNDSGYLEFNEGESNKNVVTGKDNMEEGRDIHSK